jgi:hypothetical protein
MQKLLLSFLLIISSVANAQTLPAGFLKISGRVVSTVTGDPIPFCSITDQNNRGTVSDSLGYFQLSDLHTGVNKIYFQTLDRGSSDTIVAMGDKDLVGMDWPVHSNCTELTKRYSNSDVFGGKQILFLQSGDPPIIYSSQKRFSKKYKVLFYEFGDLIQYPYDCLVICNRGVFEQLDKKYGKKWRNDLRPNVPGYK